MSVEVIVTEIGGKCMVQWSIDDQRFFRSASSVSEAMDCVAESLQSAGLQDTIVNVRIGEHVYQARFDRRIFRSV